MSLAEKIVAKTLLKVASKMPAMKAQFVAENPGIAREVDDQIANGPIASLNDQERRELTLSTFGENLDDFYLRQLFDEPYRRKPLNPAQLRISQQITDEQCQAMLFLRIGELKLNQAD